MPSHRTARALVPIAWLAAGALACACRSEAAAGAADAPAGAAARVTELALEATDGELLVPFTLDVHGRADGGGVSAALENGTGTVRLGRGERIPAVAYWGARWSVGTDALRPAFTVYQALAVTPGALVPLWFYCDGPELFRIWWESSDGGGLLTDEASGRCAETLGPARVGVALPAGRVSVARVATGFDVEGPELHLPEDGQGTMRLGGATWDVHPFSVVSCEPEVCGSDWDELHAVFRRSDGGPVCFGIFYLDRATPAAVSLSYALCLPDLSLPSAAFDASWRPR